MKTITLKLKENSYPIIIGEDVLKLAGKLITARKLGKDAFIITHPVLCRLYGGPLKASLKSAGISVKFFEVPEGERSKSSATAVRLLEQIARQDVFKKPFVIALGGGVIGDLAGFVAAVYKRGIPYVQIPTTLLAQIDSAIGGKVAIDLSVGKNLVGAFFQPKLVLSDVKVLKTLDDRQIRNGLAEAVKYGVIADLRLFRFLVKRHREILNRNIKDLVFLVAACSRIKANVVMADEKETKGIRTILNFGHTVGHAVESAGGLSIYHHGEAVALGMRVAVDISVQRKMLSITQADQINNLLSSIGLPEKIHGLRIKDILHYMSHDKKFVAGKNRFVLATRIGQVKVVEGIPQDLLLNSIQKFQKN